MWRCVTWTRYISIGWSLLFLVSKSTRCKNILLRPHRIHSLNVCLFINPPKPICLYIQYVCVRHIYPVRYFDCSLAVACIPRHVLLLTRSTPNIDTSLLIQRLFLSESHYTKFEEIYFIQLLWSLGRGLFLEILAADPDRSTGRYRNSSCAPSSQLLIYLKCLGQLF